MYLSEESLRNITIRKNKRNFRLSTTEDHRIISFNTETVSPTFPQEVYPRIGEAGNFDNLLIPVINDYDELNSILQRESEQRSVFQQDAETLLPMEGNLKASPPKQRKLRCRAKNDLMSIAEEKVASKINVHNTRSKGDCKTPAPPQGQTSKLTGHVSNEASPTPSHETIEFPSSDNDNIRSRTDLSETFFDPVEPNEQKCKQIEDCVPEKDGHNHPNEDSSDKILTNITYRNKHRTIFNESSVAEEAPNRVYTKSMSDIFTDSTFADKSRKSKSLDGQCRLDDQIGAFTNPTNQTSTDATKGTNVEASQSEDKSESTSVKSGTKSKNTDLKSTIKAIKKKNEGKKDKSVNKSKYFLRSKLSDHDSNMSNEHDVRISKQSTEPTSDKDRNPSDKSSKTIRNVNQVQTDKEHDVDEQIAIEKSKRCDQGNQTDVQEVEYLGTSRTDENSPSQWSHISTRRKKKQTPKPKTPSIDSNPIVLLNDCDIVHISPKLTDRVCKNQSVQTQSSFDSKSTFDTKSTVVQKQTVVTSVCKSCKKKTPMRVRNFGSYENEEEDDDEDFVSNDVSNLSGIKRLGVRSEGKAKQQGDTGKIMEGVVAYVDIRLDGSDKSRGVIKILNHLGAKVSKFFDRNVTHIIFYEGALSTVEKARKFGIPLVSVAWVSACKTSRLLLSSEAFPPIHIEDYMDSIKQNKDELFKTVLRTVAKDLDAIVSSNSSPEEIEVPLSILILRKYVTPYEEDSEHIYNLSSIEISLSLDRRRKLLLRRLLFPHRPVRDSTESASPSDNSFSPVQLTPRCSAPARLWSKDRTKRRREKAFPFGAEVERIRSLLGTGRKEEREEEETQQKQDFRDVIDRLRSQTKPSAGQSDRATKNIPSKSIEPGPSIRKAATPSLLAVKKRIHFRRSSLPNKLKNKTPACNSPRPPMSGKRVESVDWKSGTDMISSSELPASKPQRRKIRKRRLYEDLSTLEDPLSSVKKAAPKRKPLTDAKKLPTVEQIFNAQKYSDVYDEKASREEAEINESSRSSSYWFVGKKVEGSKNRGDPVSRSSKPGIVCTGINAKDIKSLYSYITELGHFIIEPRVSSRTTHVVVEGPKRTLNLLKGIVRGCWVVKVDWVHASYNVGRWLYEQRFELTSFSPAIQRCRMERQTFGSLYAFDLLSKFGSIFVSKSSKPPRADLQELIVLCGGRLSPSMRAADLILGGEVTKDSRKTHVREVWLLDCITKCSQLDVDKYRL
ncbi:hypothetical protein M8J77_022174 [Diaphorina citri]|nr:hypothetical protein M8J77_022174 [Diaphorina citri]